MANKTETPLLQENSYLCITAIAQYVIILNLNTSLIVNLKDRFNPYFCVNIEKYWYKNVLLSWTLNGYLEL